MNLEHLRTVIAVWRLRSISKAAAEIGLTQPAVSGHVKAMEAMLGKPLFRRHARGVDPTEAAEELVRSVGASLDIAEAAVERVRVRSDARPGVVHFGAPAEFSNARLAPVFAALAQAGIEVRLRHGPRDRLYDWFREGEIDIGITASEPVMATLDYEPVFRERLLLVAAPSFQPALTACMSKTEITDWASSAPWLAYDESLPLIRSWLAKVTGGAATGRARIVAPSLVLLRDLACEGVGASVLPHYLCRGELENGRLVKLYEPTHDPTNMIYLCWRRRSMRDPRIVRAREICLQELDSASEQ
ncbi:MAG: LysR family transcriptional regulator [Pseudomonadota bacterium]